MEKVELLKRLLTIVETERDSLVACQYIDRECECKCILGHMFSLQGMSDEDMLIMTNVTYDTGQNSIYDIFINKTVLKDRNLIYEVDRLQSIQARVNASILESGLSMDDLICMQELNDIGHWDDLADYIHNLIAKELA